MAFRSGFVAIIGRANVGKSTLLNALVGHKLAIVSAKPHTTRHKLLGVLHGEGFQAALLDTPGYLSHGRDQLDVAMARQIATAFADADVVVLVAEARPPGDVERDFIAQIKSPKTPAILAINKIDRVSKSRLLPIIEHYAAAHDFKAIVPVSALKDDGLDVLLEQVVAALPEQEPIFPPEHLTDRPPEFLMAEIIREKVFALYRDEVPYDVAVEVEAYETRSGDAPDLLQAIVHVGAASQKRVLIGHGGEAIKQVGIDARPEIEALAGRRVFVELWVKVSPAWRKKAGFVQRTLQP